MLESENHENVCVFFLLQSLSLRKNKHDFSCSYLNVLRMGFHGIKDLDLPVCCNVVQDPFDWLSFTPILGYSFHSWTIQSEVFSCTVSDLAIGEFSEWE